MLRSELRSDHCRFSFDVVIQEFLDDLVDQGTTEPVDTARYQVHMNRYAGSLKRVAQCTGLIRAYRRINGAMEDQKRRFRSVNVGGGRSKGSAAAEGFAVASGSEKLL